VLDDTQIESLQVKFRKVGVVSWEGHQILFRKPQRAEWHEYLRRKDTRGESHTALEQLTQQTIVAFDGETDVTKARVTYSNIFLEECPGFANAPEVSAILAVLAGTAQEEEVESLKKVGVVWSGRRNSTPMASQNGSVTAAVPTVDANSPQRAARRPS
jgi:hypothetical protein